MNDASKKINLPKGYYTACGGHIYEPERYLSVVYKGKQVFFCNKNCFEAFKTDPDRFMAGEIEHPLGQDQG
jgi:YHS domain-containing protein